MNAVRAERLPDSARALPILVSEKKRPKLMSPRSTETVVEKDRFSRGDEIPSGIPRKHKKTMEKNNHHRI